MHECINTHKVGPRIFVIIDIVYCISTEHFVFIIKVDLGFN